MSQQTPVIVETDGPVTTVIIDRPEKRGGHFCED